MCVSQHKIPAMEIFLGEITGAQSDVGLHRGERGLAIAMIISAHT